VKNSGFGKLILQKNITMQEKATAEPLRSLDEWEDDLLRRYPDPQDIANARPAANYRNYEEPTRDSVMAFYEMNHRWQSYDFVKQKQKEFLSFDKREMSVWEAFDFLNQLVDDSDPDTDLDQFQHLLQTSEAIRRDGHPDWMVLVGLMHDMGKVLCLFGEPQWAVVGDTFPVGCAYSDKVVYPSFFSQNPDATDSRYNTRLGIYKENCGLRQVDMSWGHDEYIYRMMKDYLPEEGLYMLRYHSFYAWHREGAYTHLTDEHDRKMLPWVQLFNPYDLYSKNPEPPDWEAIKPYYTALLAKYLPAKLRF